QTPAKATVMGAKCAGGAKKRALETERSDEMPSFEEALATAIGPLKAQLDALTAIIGNLNTTIKVMSKELSEAKKENERLSQELGRNWVGKEVAPAPGKTRAAESSGSSMISADCFHG
ncbi:hypothetical protein HDU98_004904, partial [Podochytrium sp. JEL0797]